MTCLQARGKPAPTLTESWQPHGARSVHRLIAKTQATGTRSSGRSCSPLSMPLCERRRPVMQWQAEHKAALATPKRWMQE